MKPILFSTEMVQAILDGRKTQTRRVIKPQPTSPRWNAIGWLGWEDGRGYKIKPQPHNPGDVLWVRETWAIYDLFGDPKLLKDKEEAWFYKKSYEPSMIDHVVYRADYGNRFKGAWRPSIHMPREAARLFLRVKDVRAERLQEITAGDVIAEGISIQCGPLSSCQACNRVEYRKLWDSLNAKRGYGWDTDPWVWVYEFERCEKPESEGT